MSRLPSSSPSSLLRPRPDRLGRRTSKGCASSPDPLSTLAKHRWWSARRPTDRSPRPSLGSAGPLDGRLRRPDALAREAGDPDPGGCRLPACSTPWARSRLGLPEALVTWFEATDPIACRDLERRDGSALTLPAWGALAIRWASAGLVDAAQHADLDADLNLCLDQPAHLVQQAYAMHALHDPWAPGRTGQGPGATPRSNSPPRSRPVAAVRSSRPTPPREERPATATTPGLVNGLLADQKKRRTSGLPPSSSRRSTKARPSGLSGRASPGARRSFWAGLDERRLRLVSPLRRSSKETRPSLVPWSISGARPIAEPLRSPRSRPPGMFKSQVVERLRLARHLDSVVSSALGTVGLERSRPVAASCSTPRAGVRRSRAEPNNPLAVIVGRAFSARRTTSLIRSPGPSEPTRPAAARICKDLDVRRPAARASPPPSARRGCPRASPPRPPQVYAGRPRRPDRRRCARVGQRVWAGSPTTPPDRRHPHPWTPWRRSPERRPGPVHRLAVRWTVHDNGLGIAATEGRNFFDPFTGGRISRPRPGSGFAEGRPDCAQAGGEPAQQSSPGRRSSPPPVSKSRLLKKGRSAEVRTGLCPSARQ